MQYKPRCKKALISEYGSNFYARHYQAIKVEGLDNREDIAAELAVRDFQIEYLEHKLWMLDQLIHGDVIKDMPQCLVR